MLMTLKIEMRMRESDEKHLAFAYESSLTYRHAILVVLSKKQDKCSR